MAKHSDALAPTYLENGRYYGTYRRGQYLFPVDEEESERLDVFHKLIQVVRPDAPFYGLHQRPIRPDRVLDLGCGTGIWIMDMAEYCRGDIVESAAAMLIVSSCYPSTRFVGLDLNSIQPPVISDNIEFRQQDITDADWALKPGSFDLVHIGMLAGCIQDWNTLYRNIHRHLRPSSGIFEHVEIDFRPLCPDGSLPADSKLRLWAGELCRAFELSGRPLVVTPNPVQLLEGAGFVDTKHEEIDIPFHPWDDDEGRKTMGRWLNLGMRQGIEALSMAPLTRFLNYGREDVRRLTAEVRKEISIKALRSSCTMHIWTARRPASGTNLPRL